jgi:glyoxylase-like metal-dependent hydrolase (beta-lactamase superfamily II)
LSFGAYPPNVARMLVHRHRSEAAGTPVNAYLVEGAEGVVAVDATLTVPGGRGLRERADALGKPLLGVVITHAHPDHYGGLVELVAGLDVPVYSTALVGEVIRRDDLVKEAILRPMFGDLWPASRAFPTHVVADGETVTLGDISLTVTDLGPSESPADSVWTLEPGRVFSGDLAYDRTHCYLADGFHEQWLANLARMRAELAAGTTLHPGHGEPCGLEVLDWQRAYIERMLAAVRSGEDVPAAMRAFLPSETLAFLMELSVEPLR